MTTLHITHNDLDGLGCAVLIKNFLPGNITTMYLGYSEVDSVIEEQMMYYDQIIVTDVSPQYGSVEMMAGEKDVLIIDHHKTSESLKDFPFTIHDNSKCATLLTYEYLIDNGYKAEEYEDFARCINDIDLWHLKRNDSLKMGVLFNLYGISRMEERFLSCPYNGFTEEEELIITLEEERRDNYINKAKKYINTYKDKDGLTFSVLFAESYASELCNSIIMEGIADYVLQINPQTKKASLRSHKDIDISGIAVRNGGGGHKNAAGFPLTNETFDLDNILKRVGII